MLERSIQSSVPLSDREIKLLVAAGTLCKLKNREQVFPDGNPGQCLVFVSKGVLRSYIKGAGGEEHVLHLIFEGEWMGDLNSWVTEEPAGIVIEALEKSEVFIFSKEKIAALILQNPGIAQYFRLFLIKEYVRVQQRLIEILSVSAESRYKNLIARYPHVIQKVPLIHIASYLGIRPESLSRIRKQVSQAG